MADGTTTYQDLLHFTTVEELWSLQSTLDHLEDYNTPTALANLAKRMVRLASHIRQDVGE